MSFYDFKDTKVDSDLNNENSTLRPQLTQLKSTVFVFLESSLKK